MRFTETSKDIRVEEGAFLRATCTDDQGLPRDAKINLNDCIVNKFGHLGWRKNGKFGYTSRNMSLTIEEVTTLHCECDNGNGSWPSSFIVLDDAIQNIDGNLVYVPPGYMKQSGLCTLL